MFEGMLARKYIGAQKRHSALTICSIAIALALITMLFSVFTTAISIMRNIAYSQGEYHILVTGFNNRSPTIDKEKLDAIVEVVSEYGTCTNERFDLPEEGTVYYIYIMLDKSIDTTLLFMGRVAKEIGVDSLDYLTNDMLILLDVKDDRAGLRMAQIIAMFYIFVLVLIIMLRLIIDTAFEISSKERERQFGVLQSIGATPKQIVRIITYEGLMLSVIGIPLGTAAGIGLGYFVYRLVLGTGLADVYLSQSKAAELVHFSVNPWLTLLGVVTGAVWVLLSAYGTGMRVIKMSPVQAISRRAGTVKKAGKATLFGKLFGWIGKIASRNNMRQPKRFIATVVSLTLSIAIFSAVTVAVTDLRSAAYDNYAEHGLNDDFDIYFFFEDTSADIAKLKEVEESGLFEDLYYWVSVTGYWEVPEGVHENNFVNIRFVNRKRYNNEFHGTPPISYDELAESGEYLANGRLTAYFDSEKSISLAFLEDKCVFCSEEEYNALPPEEQEKYSSYIIRDENGNETYGYEYTPRFTVDFEINGKTTTDEDGGLFLTATYEQFKNGAYLLFSDTTIHSRSISCVLLDQNDYYKAIDFFEQNSIPYQDNSAEYRRFLALLASVNIVAVFLSIMIALIAVVNMVNILATGILNRRGELAALQCVGMTEKELYKMTAVECLQYALTSGIAAIAVCELLMFLTEKMLYIVIEEMEDLGDFISYIQPLPIIGAASLCAFIIAVAASIIPLRAMRRTSLVEQIRSVE